MLDINSLSNNNYNCHRYSKNNNFRLRRNPIGNNIIHNVLAQDVNNMLDFIFDTIKRLLQFYYAHGSGLYHVMYYDNNICHKLGSV